MVRFEEACFFAVVEKIFAFSVLELGVMARSGDKTQLRIERKLVGYG